MINARRDDHHDRPVRRDTSNVESARKGLETGYAADLVVLDHDILGEDTTVLARTRVTHTYADGREVYRR